MEIFTVPKALREKLGGEEADSLIDLLNRSNKQQREDILLYIREKFGKRLAQRICTISEYIESSTSDIIRVTA